MKIGNFSVLGEHEKKEKIARAARRRRGAQARRAKAPLEISILR